VDGHGPEPGVSKGPALAHPPLGWNSWDVYGASVREDEVLENAKHMAAHLAPFGWEYVVVDIQWYEPGASSSAYRPFVPLEMDEVSRLVPAANRFPSAAGGAGFEYLARRIHALGLKFGIHVMRGVPRQAVHANTPILGTTAGARDIAQTNSICPWNTDMYGVDPSAEGAQEYYDSLFSLYAKWGVDFVKVDDILLPYAAGEIECIRRAIDRAGRDIVLSLSCGPTELEHADHLRKNADTWRIAGDFWDRWEDLYSMFEPCRAWAVFSGSGHWPDADMLPLGRIALRSCERGCGDRWTRFTRAEQRTMMSLWSIVGSPLMLGSFLPDLDGWTLGLLTNREILDMHRFARNPRQVSRQGDCVTWAAEGPNGSSYMAIFNLGVSGTSIAVTVQGTLGEGNVHDLWSGARLGPLELVGGIEVDAHGVRVFGARK
jgi:alpha-galactosidase